MNLISLVIISNVTNTLEIITNEKYKRLSFLIIVRINFVLSLSLVEMESIVCGPLPVAT